MEIFIERLNRQLDLKFSGSVSDLLVQIKISSEECLVVRDGELLLEDELLHNSDKIRILSVVSGG